METLRGEILRLEPRIDLLHDCLGFGRFAEVTVTSDGFFLARDRDDIGFNRFLGAPSPAAMERTRKLFAQLDERHRKEVVRTLRAHDIPPTSLGIFPTKPQPTSPGEIYEQPT
jgi:hypothetical protein